jgi:hypothetical protein
MDGRPDDSRVALSNAARWHQFRNKVSQAYSPLWQGRLVVTYL